MNRVELLDSFIIKLGSVHDASQLSLVRGVVDSVHCSSILFILVKYFFRELAYSENLLINSLVRLSDEELA